jgi:hypothetical protein
LVTCQLNADLLAGRGRLREEVFLLEIVFPALPGLRACDPEVGAATSGTLADDDGIPEATP